MARRLIALLIVALTCLPILARHNTSPLNEDTDTSVLIRSIRQRHAPLSWFTTDWPLQNHFYRPLPTLTFELDNALYGDSPAGYGWTNAILCVLGVFSLFWFVSELADSIPFATACSALFAFWIADLGPLMIAPCYALAALSLLIGLARHGKQVGGYLPAVLLFTFLARATASLKPDLYLGASVLEWLPGRTATVMTLFALGSLAAYARFERLHSERDENEITPLDLPATRTSVQPPPEKPPPWIWPVLSLLLGALALASYEQAVMLPVAILLVGLSFRFRCFRARWAVSAAMFVLVAAYAVFRQRIISPDPSAYQAQQLRGVQNSSVLDLVTYVFPALPDVQRFMTSLDTGWMIALTLIPYKALLGVVANAEAYFEARDDGVLLFTGLFLSFFAFFPMAFLKPFQHYHYWPLAMRTIFVISLVALAGQRFVTAASPRALQAPLRPSPAPGSLPHP